MRGASLGPLASAALALGLGACRGPAEISLGSVTQPAKEKLFISPTGQVGAAGTREHPLKTFEEALTRLEPGWSLTLLDGLYDNANGPLVARCDGVTAKSGTDDLHRVTIRAENKRRAWLRGDGGRPPIVIESCKYWTIEDLRVESADTPPSGGGAAPDGGSPIADAEAGSVIVLGANNQYVTLRGLLARTANVYARSHILRIGDGSSDVLVEGCELYDFHLDAVAVTRASSVTLRRNYINGSEKPDEETGAVGSSDPTSGDFGVLLEETSNVLAENNVIEGVHDGFGVVGRSPDLPAAALPPAPAQVRNNRLFGNVVINPAGAGVRLASRCQNKSPCTPHEHKVIDTVLQDDVVVGGSIGVYSAGAINTQIRQLSVINAANGVLLNKEPQNVGLQPTTFVYDSLVAGFQNVAFRVATGSDTMWTFDRCAVDGGLGPKYWFQPEGVNVSMPITVAPNLGACFAFIPASSPLKGMGSMGDVGANVVYRYEDGILDKTMRLWDAATGEFPCGDVVIDNQTCKTVHKRLNMAPVGTTATATACPLP